MTFYTYGQNNSGGGFNLTDDLTHFVIIEAYSAREAAEKAQELGMYFDGCSNGIDCPCCGDRWHEVYEDEGTETPEVYGKHPSEYFNQKLSHRWMPEGKEIVVHYATGRKEWF